MNSRSDLVGQVSTLTTYLYTERRRLAEQANADISQTVFLENCTQNRCYQELIKNLNHLSNLCRDGKSEHQFKEEYNAIVFVLAAIQYYFKKGSFSERTPLPVGMHHLLNRLSFSQDLAEDKSLYHAVIDWGIYLEKWNYFSGDEQKHLVKRSKPIFNVDEQPVLKYATSNENYEWYVGDQVKFKKSSYEQSFAERQYAETHLSRLKNYRRLAQFWEFAGSLLSFAPGVFFFTTGIYEAVRTYRAKKSGWASAESLLQSFIYSVFLFPICPLINVDHCERYKDELDAQINNKKITRLKISKTEYEAHKIFRKEIKAEYEMARTSLSENKGEAALPPLKLHSAEFHSKPKKVEVNNDSQNGEVTYLMDEWQYQRYEAFEEQRRLRQSNKQYRPTTQFFQGIRSLKMKSRQTVEEVSQNYEQKSQVATVRK